MLRVGAPRRRTRCLRCRRQSPGPGWGPDDVRLGALGELAPSPSPSHSESELWANLGLGQEGGEGRRMLPPRRWESSGDSKSCEMEFFGAALQNYGRWNKQWKRGTKCPQVRLPTPPLLNPLARHRIRLLAFAPIGNTANYPCRRREERAEPLWKARCSQGRRPP